MSFNMNEMSKRAASGPRPVPKVGTQGGRIQAVVDLGVQERPPFKGEEKKPVRMCWINVELAEKFELNGEKVPFRISLKDFTISNDPKSSLFKFMRQIDPEDQYKGDLSLILNLPILATIIHRKVSQADGSTVTYANISSISLPPDGFPVPELSEGAVLFTFDAPEKETLEALPKFIREKIEKSLSFPGSKVEELVKSLAAQPQEKPQY